VLTRLAELYQCSVADLVADLADFREDDEATRSGSGNLTGLWLSRYCYYSSGREDELHGEHKVWLQHNGAQILGHNDAEGHESRLKLDLSLSGAIATGTWTERTSTVGYYRGAVYHGTIQLVVSPQGRRIR
jgi:hypothetical protein